MKSAQKLTDAAVRGLIKARRSVGPTNADLGCTRACRVRSARKVMPIMTSAALPLHLVAALDSYTPRWGAETPGMPATGR